MPSVSAHGANVRTRRGSAATTCGRGSPRANPLPIVPNPTAARSTRATSSSQCQPAPKSTTPLPCGGGWRPLQGKPMNAQSQQLTKKVPDNFPAMLERFKGEIARALPRHLDGDRMARIALTSFRSNPRLSKCEPRSVFASIIIASQLGLEPGVMGQCYLIPYKDECQLQIGYQGLIELVRRSGKVTRIEAHVVHANDVFEYTVGLTTALVHKPVLDGDPGDPRLAYAVAEFDGGCFHVEVMTRSQIEAIRDRSQNVISAKKYGKKTPWDTDPDEMWRKTLIRRICKYLPKSAELGTALALDNSADAGKQHVNIDDAIEGTWAPVQDDDDAPAGVSASVVSMPQAKAHPAPDIPQA